MASSLSAARLCGHAAAAYASSASSSAAVARNADDVRVRVSIGSMEVLRRSNVWGQRITLHQPFAGGASKVKASPISMGWTPVPGGLKTISSGDDKMVVGTDSQNNLWQLKDDKFEPIPLNVLKIAEVSTGFSGMWAVSTEKQLLHWDEVNSEFEEIDPMPGSGKIAHVASGQDVYVIDTKRQIFKYQGEGVWTQLDALLDFIDTNDYGDLWGIQLGEMKKVYRRFQGRWIYVPGPEGRDNVKQITTGLAGVWAVDGKGTVYRWVMNTSETGAWFKEEGSLANISSGHPTVWGLDKTGKVYKHVP